MELILKALKSIKGARDAIKTPSETSPFMPKNRVQRKLLQNFRDALSAASATHAVVSCRANGELAASVAATRVGLRRVR